MPPLRSQGEIRLAGPRPAPVTAPIEQTLADTMAGPAAAGIEGGRLLKHGYQTGDPKEMAGGIATAILGGTGWRGGGKPKWQRMMEAESRAG